MKAVNLLILGWVKSFAIFAFWTRCSVLWNYDGIIHSEFVPDGWTIDANLYYKQLEWMHAIMLQKSPALFNRKWALQQEDLILLKWLRINTRNFRESNWCHNQQYSLNLAPLDYYYFSIQGEVEAFVKEFFIWKDKNWYQLEIKQLAERWLQIVWGENLCGVMANMLDFDIVVSSSSSQAIMFNFGLRHLGKGMHLLTLPPNYWLNSTTTFLLQGWIWH